MPKDAAEAFKNNSEATFCALLEGAVSARTKRERPEIREVMRSHFTVQSNFPKYVFGSAIADPHGVFNWNIKSRLGEIREPTIVLAGEEDQGTPVAANKLLADNIPGAKLSVIKEVGHFYQLERPMEFNAAVKGFIAGLNLKWRLVSTAARTPARESSGAVWGVCLSFPRVCLAWRARNPGFRDPSRGSCLYRRHG